MSDKNIVDASMRREWSDEKMQEDGKNFVQEEVYNFART